MPSAEDRGAGKGRIAAMTLLYLLAGLFAFFYIGGPILIKFTNRSSAHPTFTALDPAHIPPMVAQYMSTVVGALQVEGFVPQAYLLLSGQVANAQAYMLLMQNAEAGDQGGIFALMSTADGSPKIVTRYVEFSTKFTSGRNFDTNNSAQLSAFTPGPERTVTQVPGVDDVRMLYRLHRYVMQQAAASEGSWGEHKLYPPGPEGHARALAAGMIDTYEQQVKKGVLQPAAGGDAYYPTWSGAFQMTWGLLPPRNWLRKSARKKREQEVLAAMQRDTATESWADRKRGAGV